MAPPHSSGTSNGLASSPAPIRIAANQKNISDILIDRLGMEKKDLINALPFNLAEFEVCLINNYRGYEEKSLHSRIILTGEKKLKVKIGKFSEGKASRTLWAVLITSSEDSFPYIRYLAENDCKQLNFIKWEEVEDSIELRPEYAFATVSAIPGSSSNASTINSTGLSALIKFYFFKAGAVIPYDMNLNMPHYKVDLVHVAEQYAKMPSVGTDQSISRGSSSLTPLTATPSLQGKKSSAAMTHLSNSLSQSDILPLSDFNRPRKIVVLPYSAPQTLPQRKDLEAHRAVEVNTTNENPHAMRTMDEYNANFQNWDKRTKGCEAEQRANEIQLKKVRKETDSIKKDKAKEEDELQRIQKKLASLEIELKKKESEVEKIEGNQENLRAQLEIIKKQRSSARDAMPLTMQTFFDNIYAMGRKDQEEEDDDKPLKKRRRI
ncbi:hypothetical protein DM02DRAFT_670089 [Periconia macrospinosa]|uniref:Uncharacterized protein n=1 Tax=Periconia macrospinosa TaxID=97972 RepID=A0A2V1DZ19_9PLEO|nr:hypothetical protein DM02DRAFT_670089 [Periconia macrospinosa]